MVALERHQLNTTRLPELISEPSGMRQWLIDDYLSELDKLIRPYRRLVWLFDDAEALIQAIANGQLPEDTFDYLYQVLQSHLQIGIVMTLEESNEAKAKQLTPLININRPQRLHPLSADETAEVMSQFGMLLTEPAQKQIYHLTDGHPLLLQFMGETLQSLKTYEITQKEIKKIVDAVYVKANDTYQTIWEQILSQNERLVLTAISGLLYDDPIRNLTTQEIENWMLETDYPLDITAINAGIRGLEYQDLLIGSTSEGIRIRAALFQRWLIEHVGVNRPATLPTKPLLESTDDSTPIGRTGIFVIALIVITVILLVAVTQQSDNISSPSAQPTVRNCSPVNDNHSHKITLETE